MSGFALTELQANAILEMRLQRLVGLERKKLDEEYAELLQEIDRLRAILGSEERVREVIRGEILDIRKRFADARRTEIVLVAAGGFEAEDLIPEEDMVITISHLGYIKRLPLTTYRAQRRGGRGKQGVTTREEDWISELFIASTHDYILFFTDKGRCYWLKVHEVPQAGRTARGKAIVNCIQIGPDERVTAFAQVDRFDEERFLVMATAAGEIKKTVLSAFGNPRRAGIRAVNLAEGDTLIEAALTRGDNEIILATRKGRAVRFHERALRAMGRTAGGVRGVRLSGSGDGVVGMVVVREDATLLTVTERGFGKRTPISEYRLTNRGGKGVINIRITSKNGPVVAIREVSKNDQVMLITSDGVVIRCRVREVAVRGRATQGVRLIAVSEGNHVTDVAKIGASKEPSIVEDEAGGDGDPGVAEDSLDSSAEGGDADGGDESEPEAGPDGNGDGAPT
jgi:DNA gyrase subunit A